MMENGPVSQAKHSADSFPGLGMNGEALIMRAFMVVMTVTDGDSGHGGASAALHTQAGLMFRAR